MRYEDASHTGAFQGQGPIANDDTDQAAAGAKSTATGNIITGEGTQTGAQGADSATDGHITAIAGKGGEDSSFSGGKLSVMGEYGKLSVDAEGNYVYQANKGVENVRDRFTYTLADNNGASDTASLIIEIGKTPFAVKADAQQVVVGPDGVVTLPAGVELSDVHVVGRNLVVDMPDGTQMIIIDGAVFVPQLVLGGVEVPATNVAALLIGQEVQPAAGENPPSSGGNFGVPPPPLDPGVPLGDLIPPTEYTYIPPDVEEIGQFIDKEPDAGAIAVQLDDDAQQGGNPGGTGDVEPTLLFASGNLPGSDGDGSLEWDLLASGSLPSGFSFSEQLNGDIWIMQGADHVLTITVNPDTGAFTVTQLQAIDHPAGGNENDLSFVINYTVTDDDGDSATGSLTVNVDDDTPVAVVEGQVTGLVDEDDLPAGNHDNADGDDNPGNADGDNDGTTTAGAAGSLSGLFSYGADQPGSTGLGTNTAGMTAQGLTSNGVALTYAVVGDTLTASAGGETVFTLTVHADGSWEFDLEGQLDHSVADTEDNLDIDFSSMIIGTDHDGDTVSLPNDTFVITVDDDLPVAVGEGRVTGLVDEDDLPAGNHDNADGDDDPGNADGDNDGTTTGGDAGSLSSLFSFGADQPGTVELSSDTSGLPALTSDGVAVTYSVSGNVLTASAGGSTVFTLTVNPDGSWVFDLQGQLDHSIAGTEDNLDLDFSSIIIGVDADGDTATLPENSFVVDVDDDMPQEFEECPDDVISVNDPGFTFTGDLHLPPVGADDPGVVTFGVVDGDPVLDNSDNPVTANGVELFYFVNDQGVLEARAGGESGDVIFTITLNGDGTFTYEQVASLGEGGQINFEDLTSASAGNVEFRGVGADDPGTTVDLLLSGSAGGADSSVNTDSDSIGTANQSMDNGETIRIDLVSDLTTGAATPSGFGYSGHVSSNSFVQLIPQVQGSQDQTTAFTVWALDSSVTQGTEPDRNPAGGFSDASITAVTEVTVKDFLTGESTTVDVTGFTVGVFTPVAYGISARVNADGSVTFSGIQQGDSYGINTGAGEFNAVVVQAEPAGTGGSTQDSFDLGIFSIGVANEFEPVDLSIPIVVTDADGDPVVCDFDIHIGPPLEAQDITVTVNEAGLPIIGSDAASNSETQGGDLQGQVSGGTGPYTFAFAAGEDGDGAFGTLTLNPDGTFSYTLDTPFDSQPDANDGTNPELDAESFQVVATDSLGATQTITVHVNIIDDVPAANNDTDSTDAGTDQAVGNVITGDGTNEGTGNADFPGADGFGSITNLVGFGGSSDNNPSGGFSVNGQYGTLQMDANGQYTYTRTGGPGGATDTFTYTYVDGDGDLATATLVITIEDNTPTAGSVSVGLDDDALANGNPGGTGDDADAVNVSGNLPGGGGDAPISFGVLLTGAPAGFTYVSGGAGIVLVKQGGVTVLTVTVGSDGSYSVVQNNPIAHAAGSDENNQLFTITYTVTDSDNDVANGTINISVDDDTPTVSANAAVQLDDDALAGGNAGGIGDDPNAANTSGTLAHSYGADGAGTVAYLTTGAPAGFTYQLQGNGDLWVLQGATHVLTLTVNASTGAYTVTQVAPIAHAAGSDENNQSFTINYSVTDSDGDSVNGSITVNVDDDTPTVSANAAVQLDDDALAGGNPGGTGDDANATNTSGTLAHSYGADGAGTVAYLTTGAPAGFSYVLQGNGDLWVMQGATHVLTLTVNAATGAYTVTQVAPIAHAAGSDENNQSFTINYQVTDSDGDSVNGSITVDVDDDTPTVSANAAVQLDDDALAGGNAGGTGDDADATNTSGTLGHSFGADGAGTIAYLTTGAPAGFSYVLQGNGDLWVMQGATHVLTLTVNAATGAYTVTQVAPIAHAAGSDENNQSFTINYSVSDSDGDSVNGSITVNVDDDTPTVSANAAVQLDDDALAGGIAGGTGDDADATNTSGTLGHSFGADGAGSIAYLTTGAPAGFTYQLQGNGDLWVLQGATHVLTLTVNASTGAYTVTQVAPIAHAAGGDENNQSFTINYSVSDSDGDSVNGSITVNVDDDTPTVSANTAVQLDDDALTGGNAGGVGDVNPDTANTSGTLGHAFGADGAGTVAYLNTGAPAGFTYQLQGNGDLWVMQGATHVITLTVNATTGAYTVTQVAPISHAAGSDENDQAFTINYRVSDSDGDTVDGSIVINVDDDTPVNFNPVDLTDTTHATATTLDDALVNNGSAVATRFINDANANPANGENFIGADGFGSLTFTATGHTNGEQLENAGGDPLTSGGDPIFVFGYGTGTLTATTDATNTDPTAVVFTVNLNTNGGNGSASTYTIDFNQTVDNGAGVTFDDLTSSKAGNVDVRAIGADDPSTTVDVILTASLNGANATINTDSDSIGAANQSMDTGETVRIDFVTNAQTDAGLPSGFSYDDHASTSTFEQTIPQVQGSQNQTVAFRVYALDTSVTDAGSPDDTPVAGDPAFSDASTVDIVNVTIDGFDVGETPVTVALGPVGTWTTVAYGVYARLESDGSVTFTGIQEGDRYGIDTGNNDFNAVAVTSLASGVGPAGHTSSTNSFDLGIFAIGQVDNGDPINLHFDVTGTDADGDTSTGGIDVVLSPDTSGQEPLVTKSAPTQTALDSSSTTLLADSHDAQKVAANSNTVATAAAVAAAGIADSQAAAASPEAANHGEEVSQVAASVGHAVHDVAGDAGSEIRSGLGIEARQAADDVAPVASSGHSQAQAAANHSVDDSQASAAANANDHAAAANDKGPAVADAHVAAAPTVAMVAAEALQAAGLTGDAKPASSVEKIVAEALGHGNGHGAVDALLDAFHGGNGGGQAIANLASGGANAVSAWDMASEGASSVAHEMLMKVGASITHHDMVPPTHNG